MTPTDLELREKIALAHEWFNIKSRTEPTRWYLANGEAQELPPLSHWAWPCLLELMEGAAVFCKTENRKIFGVWLEEDIDAHSGEAEPLGSDPDPARAVILAWLKFKGGE